MTPRSWLTAVVPPHLALDPCSTLAGERLGTDWSVVAAGLLIVVAVIVVSVMRPWRYSGNR